MDRLEQRPFGTVLRGYRVTAGLSQEELAARAQLSRRTISDLERGVTSAPYRSTVALLADALELDAARAALDRAARRAVPTPAPLVPWPGRTSDGVICFLSIVS
jgi:transcriptional regulator with XRE-family HTH domain